MKYDVFGAIMKYDVFGAIMKYNVFGAIIKYDIFGDKITHLVKIYEIGHTCFPHLLFFCLSHDVMR